MLSQAAVEHATRALKADIAATLGGSVQVDVDVFTRSIFVGGHIVSSQQASTSFDDDASFVDWLVEDVQQYVHDTYIDTTWPACPRHPNHPLWSRNGWWCCGDERIAELGNLKSIQPASR